MPRSLDIKVQSHITLQNHLPVQMVNGATILIRTSQQHIELAVDGKIIYNSQDDTSHLASPSSAYHFIRLPTDAGGKLVRVVLSSPYSNYAGFISEIHIGSKASHLFFLLYENGARLIIGFLVLCTGVLLILLFLFTKGYEGNAANTNLGGFFVCAGYWVMVESRMMQFIFPYPVALTNSSIFALSLLPVFGGMYYYHSHTKAYRKVGKYTILLAIAVSCTFAVLAFVNPELPIHILPVYLGFMAIYLVLLFVAVIRESVKAGKLFSISMYGIMAFSLCALIELVIYLSNMKTYNKSNILTIGLLLFCVFMVLDSIQAFTQVYRNAIKVDALSVLAYRDSLTGLGNRTAFIKELSSINQGSKQGVTIAMYDVNNLKIVNDTKGHLVGDALLCHCANAIKLSLRAEDKLYRIGGDEFVAILRNNEPFDENALAQRLLEVVKNENQKQLSYTVSIAYGYAAYSQEYEQTLYDTQAKADEYMYARKRIQKAEYQAAATESDNLRVNI